MISAPTASLENAGLAFRQAASKGDLSELIRLYEQYGKQIVESCGEKSGRTALHQAAIANKTDIAKQLMAWGADVNCKDEEGNTPLIFAYQHERLEMADFLLEQDNLDAMHKNKSGKNALMTCPSLLKGDFILLFDKFREKVTVQIEKLENGIEGVCFESDGDITIAYDIQDLEAKFNEKGNTAYASGGNGQMRVIKNEKGMNLDFDFDAKHNFMLPPLVFLMVHDDPATFNIIKRNFNYLSQVGYKAICLELDSDKSAEVALSEFANGIFGKKMNCADKEIAAMHADFMCAFRSAGFAYHGVDAPLGIMREIDCPLRKVIFTPEVIDYRDEYIAKMMMKYAEQYNGGIIVLIGSGHVGFLNTLKIINKGVSDPFILYQVSSTQEMYIPSGDSLRDKLKRLCVTTGSDIVSIDSTKPEQQEKFEEPILKFIERDGKVQDYSQTVDTMLSRKLQLVHAAFKGMLRERNKENPDYVVDAVLPVQNVQEYRCHAREMHKKIEDLTMNMERIKIGDETSLSLVVKDINGGRNGESVNRHNSPPPRLRLKG